MLGGTRIREIADKVLRLSGADQTEVMFFGENSALTRFANNYIHQNVAEINTQVNIRLVMGKKVGVASTNDLSDEGLQRAVEHAATITRFQLENPDFKSLPTPQEAGQAAHGKGYVEATTTATPEMRAEGAGVICRLASENGLTAAGAFSTSEQELAVANSLGVFGYDTFTTANLLTVVMGDNSSGYADRASMDVREIDAEGAGREAVDKALRSKDPVAVEPGEYTVVLEEYAVADLLEWLNLTGGFSALALQEGRSFLKKGEAITGGNITIYDDGGDPRGLPIGIDFEGVAKRRVDLITNGVARDPVYDSYTAGRQAADGKHSTGHALPAPNSFGPIPINLIMDGGDTPKEDLAKGIERGIWVTRCHYLSVVHPLMTILTGMTRDGTFLIENGEITRPIKNLRFTQNLLEAWGDATLSEEPKLRKGELIGSLIVPAIRIERFKFVSGTSF